MACCDFPPTKNNQMTDPQQRQKTSQMKEMVFNGIQSLAVYEIIYEEKPPSLTLCMCVVCVSMYSS